ncbi:hypothetical protein ACTD5D_40035 [Nocardia takedensis]|uniref:hypothetical protein n=1 Tax=Nocardia takedensis TaxID=259390 RepID=UPI003F761FB8
MLVLAQGMVMPPGKVTYPFLTLLGYFLWFVALILVVAAMWAAVEFAAAFLQGQGIDRASTRLLVVMGCAILASTASAWGALLLT